MKGKCPTCASVQRLYLCSNCDLKLCQTCMEFHQDRSGHEPKIDPKEQKAVKWMLGWVGKWVELTKDKLFQQDESTKWFGLWRDPTSLLWLVETPRVEQLLLESRRRSGLTRTFPRLVAFVGQTGVGKSTIIRGLMSARGGEGLVGDESPIAAPADGNPCASTTGEVNLYADPATFETGNPILYVDCEGFSGTKPLAAEYQSRWYSKDIRYRDYRIDESSTHATSRIQAAKEIYPRFLYIFSDVVCLVVEQPRLIRDAVISLLKWSQTCSSHVVNQFSIPSAILIINNWDPAKWNSSKLDGRRTLEEEVFLELEGEGEALDPFLKELMRKCDASTIQDLVNLRYSSFEICCIPQTHYNGMTLSSPTEVMDSLGKLGRRIDDHSNSVSDQRQQIWARLDSGQLQTLFYLAFKHLASGRSGAFDFSRSLQGMELPSSASDHLSRFLDILLREDVERRFDFTARSIAESLAIEAIANPEQVPLPDSILSEELRGKIDIPAEKFLSQSLRCAFIGPEGERCVNTRKGHTRGHQSFEGNDLGSGDFDAAEFTSRRLLKAVTERVRELISEVNTKPASQRRNWLVTRHLLTLTSAHESRLLPATVQGSEGLLAKLSSVCFGCLIRKPEYRLPCNHHICGTCIERFQDQDHSLSYFHVALHRKCFICGSTEPPGSWPISVALQPPLAGVRALSLDGGGTRGMMELEILRRLEQKIGLGIPIAKFFDLIIGTNAGGFIAIGLGVHGWDVETASSKFSQLVNGGLVRQPVPSWFFSLFQNGPSSVYDSDAFEAQLRRIIIGTETSLFGLCPSNGISSNPTRVAVTVSQADKPFLLANYNYGDNKTYLDSRRPTWAASRATWASPYYFKPFQGSNDTNHLFDGGLFHNNPTSLVFDEKRHLWPDNVNLDVILSLGSGSTTKPDETPPINSSHIEPWVQRRKKDYFNPISDTQETKEHTHKDAEQNPVTRVIRLNVDCSGHRFELYDSDERLYEMKKLVSSYSFFVPGGDSLVEAATRLKASLFYLDLETLKHSGNGTAVTIEGTIRCRVLNMTAPDSNTKPLEEFLQRLVKGVDNYNDTPFRLMRGVRDENEPREKCLQEGPGSCDGILFMKKVKFTLDVADEEEDNSIEVVFRHEGGSPPEDDNRAPISGSPFTLKKLRQHASRHLQPVTEKIDIGLVVDYKPW